MPLKKLASSHAHAILAKLIDLGAVPPGQPISMTARSEDHELQVVVHITRYEPWIADPETMKTFMDRVAKESAPPTTNPPRIELSVDPDTEPEVIACILGAASANAVPMTTLARRAGYKYTKWFRDHINALVEADRLKRTKRGISLPTARS